MNKDLDLKWEKLLGLLALFTFIFLIIFLIGAFVWKFDMRIWLLFGFGCLLYLILFRTEQLRKEMVELKEIKNPLFKKAFENIDFKLIDDYIKLISKFKEDIKKIKGGKENV